MNQLLLLAMCFLYSLKKFTIEYLAVFPAIMQYKKSVGNIFICSFITD